MVTNCSSFAFRRSPESSGLSCDFRVFLEKAQDSRVGEPAPPSEPDRLAAGKLTETPEGRGEIVVGQRKDLLPQILVRQQSDEYGLSPIGVEAAKLG